MDNKIYRTKQRENLLEFFRDNNDKCFLAKDIIKNSSISLGEATIYRTLSKFTEDGILKKFISQEGGGAYYQYNECMDSCSSHFHLKCVKCGTLIHLSCDFLESLESHISDDHCFTVSSGKTVIYGTCATCNATPEREGRCCCSCHKSWWFFDTF